MTFYRLIRQSFLHYFRRNLLVAIGVAISTAVLTGALMIGDSVRFSLEQITWSRLGNVTYMVSAGDRWIRTALADEISSSAGLPTAPLALMSGIAVSDGGQQRVNNIEVIGVDPRFGKLQGTPIFDQIPDDGVVISENLAARLKVAVGDPIQVRIPKASMVPRNAPFVSDDETTVSWRTTVHAIAGRTDMGYFNLKNSQSVPYNLFVSAEKLNSLAGFSGKANTILIGGNADITTLLAAVKKNFRPEDASLAFKYISLTHEFEVSTERVFLEDNGADIFTLVEGARPVLTYFVNRIEFNGHSVPYSFVSSWDIPGLQSGEILVNSWAASDLNLKPGDTLAMHFFEIGPLRQLNENQKKWIVKGIVPMTGEFGDRDLMPAIPGLSDAGHCREWKAGIPVQLDAIREKDETYWNEFKGMPKAFISLQEAQDLWSNRFGKLTSIRFPGDNFSEEIYRQQFAAQADPADFGISIREVRDQGLASARMGVDFGQLFLGLSFFLLLGAIILAALLFRLNLENRATQVGSLLQLGFTKSQISRVLFVEGLLIAVPGILAGLLLSTGYVKIIFAFLNSLWWDIVRTPSLFLRVEWGTLLLSFGISLVISAISFLIPLRRYVNRKVATLSKNLQSEGNTLLSRISGPLSLGLILAAVLLVGWQFMTGGELQPMFFFFSGALILAGFLLFINYLVFRDKLARQSVMHPYGTAIRSLSMNRSRSLTVIALFALGTFIVVTTGANRQDMQAAAEKESSGTGGFSHMAELSVPLLYDLNDSVRRVKEGIEGDFYTAQFHRVDGDDASCLNLNRISNPAILGVDVADLAGRFTFVTTTEDLDPQNPWESLENELTENVIPAIADQTVIQWGLGMKAGDTLLYQAENGDTIRLRLIGGLAPSVFQGNILIDNRFFLKYYPTHSGSSLLLLDIPADNRETVAPGVNDLLRDNGIDMVTTVEKLVGFYSVTNTYLAIFLALGAMGLVLGTVGLTVVLARSILERKRELAVLMAIGFTKKQVVGRLFSEYSLLLIMGTLTGIVAAAVTLLPVITGNITSLPILWIISLIVFIMLHGMAWIYGLSYFMIKKERVTEALRDE